MNKKSKEFIRDKIEQSYLFQIARDQAVDTIAIIRQLIDSADWNLVAENMPELKTADERHPPLTEFRDEK